MSGHATLVASRMMFGEFRFILSQGVKQLEKETAMLQEIALNIYLLARQFPWKFLWCLSQRKTALSIFLSVLIWISVF
jgi:hypothetical protein